MFGKGSNEDIGEGCFIAKSSLKKTKSSMLPCFGFYWWFMHCCQDRGGIFLPFLKSTWWNSCKKCPPCTRRTEMFVTSWINSWLQRMLTQRILQTDPHHSHFWPLLLALSGIKRQCFLQTFLIQFHMKFSFYLFSWFITWYSIA